MKFRALSTYLLLICISVGMLIGIRAVQRDLDKQVAKHHLRFTGQIKNAPPLVVFTTVAMGSFRGLVADLLWLRAGSLKDKGSYYEQVQLARWIVDLQPTFSGATVYLAWNMAYNISVTCSDFADRWRWVNEGLNLIRDKAIEYNPEDYQLYKELAWIFQHKIGNVMDDANLYYKNQLALQMAAIFGNSPDWKQMAAAPVGKKAFLAEYPADHRLWTAAAEAGIRDYDALYAAFKNSAPDLPPELGKALARDKKLYDAVLNYLRAELFFVMPLPAYPKGCCGRAYTLKVFLWNKCRSFLSSCLRVTAQVMQKLWFRIFFCPGNYADMHFQNLSRNNYCPK